MTDQAQQAILQGAMGVAMALAIGYVLYRIIKTKDSPSKASDYGRNWMAWIVMISTMATLPNAINNPSPDTIAKGVVALIVFSLIAFLVGFAYGKFKLRKTNTSTNKPTPNKTVANTDIQSNKTICSECGAEIKPANAKFCGRCGAKVERPKQVASKTINAEVVKPPTIEKQVVNNDKTPTPVKPVQTTSQSKPLTKHTKSKAITRSDSSPYKAIIITFIVLAVFVVALQKYNTSSNNTPYGAFTYDNDDVYTDELKNSKYDKKGSSTPDSWDGEFDTLKQKWKTTNNASKEKNGENKNNIANRFTYGEVKIALSVWGSSWYGTYTYNGELKNGIPHGSGTLTDTDDYGNITIIYKGEWKNGKRHGYGVATSTFGDQYIGEWRNNHRHGTGSSKMTNSYDYTGEWEYDMPNGLGTKTLNNGYKAKGRFKNGKKVD